MPEQKPMSSLYITKGNTTYDLEMKDSVARAAIADATPLVFGAGLSKTTESGTTTITAPEMTGATAQGGGASGLVPAPTAGDQAKFLKGDGTWDTVADSPLFMATYTATTGNAMKAAIQSGKAVMCNARGYAPSQFGLLGKCDLNNNKYQFLYIYKNTNAYAQQLGDIAFRMVFCSNSGSSSWFGQFGQLTFKAPTAAGQVMKSASNGSGEFDWTLSTVSEVPTSAVGDAGKVLSVNSSGTAEWILPSNMTGATASTDGASGLVPAPLAEEKDKFLKGDGTWAAPPEANLANYYYDGRGNGLSAKRTGYNSPYGTTSLVGGQGNMNDYTIEATFLIDWGGIARDFFSVNTSVPGASRIGFGINSTDARAMRYLLPTPVANKYAKTDANGKITWGDVPSLPSPTINDSLLLGQADGSETWTALENDVFGTRLPDEETGEPMYDASSTDQLWTGFAGKKFGAARAVADQDGNVFGETYARKLLPATKVFAASVTVDNNRVTSITGVTGSVAIDITVAPGECANTVVELTTGSSVTADSAVTVTVNGVAAGRAAATDGKISASKKYQVTCVGTCWTMAEFETANA